VGNIDLKMISTIENSNKFPKTRFWKEKSIEDIATLGPTTHATIVNINKDGNPSTTNTRHIKANVNT
jgi:hypothetical protein